LSERLWKEKPRLKVVWCIGYKVHEWDVHYYDQIRERMTDPRLFFHWPLEEHQDWALPDATGTMRPLTYFSKNMLHYDRVYDRPLMDIRDRARRVTEAGLRGFSMNFEPGYYTASIYGRRIPFPVELIPYRLTRFGYREFTWDPKLTWNEFRARTQKKFFAP